MSNHFPRLTRRLGVSWIEQSALRTIQRIIQILPEFKGAEQWAINRPDDDIPDNDHTIFRYFMWNKSTIQGSVAEPSDPCSLVIAYQPPWILSPHDLKQFTRTQSVSIPSSVLEVEPVSSFT